MAHLTLNCPTCRKQLVQLPQDGLTLHFRCENHGVLVFTPLVQLTSNDEMPRMTLAAPQFHTHDAALS